MKMKVISVFKELNNNQNILAVELTLEKSLFQQIYGNLLEIYKYKVLLLSILSDSILFNNIMIIVYFSTISYIQVEIQHG
jgi:hypothetical protein